MTKRGRSPTSEGPPPPLKNQSAPIKLQAKGIFRGAKVLRGPDWDWGNQDGRREKEREGGGEGGREEGRVREEGR